MRDIGDIALSLIAQEIILACMSAQHLENSNSAPASTHRLPYRRPFTLPAPVDRRRALDRTVVMQRGIQESPLNAVTRCTNSLDSSTLCEQPSVPFVCSRALATTRREAGCRAGYHSDFDDQRDLRVSGKPGRVHRHLLRGRAGGHHLAAPAVHRQHGRQLPDRLDHRPGPPGAVRRLHAGDRAFV
jgi:hypothetical protein